MKRKICVSYSLDSWGEKQYRLGLASPAALLASACSSSTGQLCHPAFPLCLYTHSTAEGEVEGPGKNSLLAVRAAPRPESPQQGKALPVLHGREPCPEVPEVPEVPERHRRRPRSLPYPAWRR